MKNGLNIEYSCYLECELSRTILEKESTMNTFYTAEKHTQILIALLKAHKIKKIVASPGTTNICLVASLQNDPYFEIYSSVDERSAAYMACGLARESGEPVALSCTGATASRNYAPGLTEAYYSNLPVLAITSTQYPGRVGQLMEQVIDRSVCMNDMVKKSIELRVIHTDEDRWAAEVAINDALLELRRHGGGPVHINLETTYSKDYSVKELPHVRHICRYVLGDKFPSLFGKKILINVGSHTRWSETLTRVVDTFCEKYNAAVICEHISNYRGKYGVYSTLYTLQGHRPKADIMIHMGEVSGFKGPISCTEVWRVHPDGEVRDTYKKLTAVFEMQEEKFFETYCDMNKNDKIQTDAYERLNAECNALLMKVPELPFSNAWIAQNTADKLPKNCKLYLGILNTVRSWSMFNIDHRKNIEVYANTGGFGIDGMVSTLLGAALVNRDKIYIGIVGDLGFFYDMNVMGNRHMPKNIRLMLINNGRGTEFRNFNHPAAHFGEDADLYMAAAGHFGNQSRELVRHFAEDLGFTYLSADSKETYLTQVDGFLDLSAKSKPVLFEVFTDSQDESDAIETLYNLTPTAAARNMAKNILGEKGINTIKKIMKR